MFPEGQVEIPEAFAVDVQMFALVRNSIME